MFKIMETCDKFFCYGMEKQSDEGCFFGFCECCSKCSCCNCRYYNVEKRRCDMKDNCKDRKENDYAEYYC